MSDTPNLDELKELNRQLTSLLDDPQTGMFSWHDCLANVLRKMAVFAPRPQAPDYSQMDCVSGDCWRECTPSRELDCGKGGKCKKCPSKR